MYYCFLKIEHILIESFAINTRNGFRVSLLLGFCVLYTYQETQQLRLLRNWVMNKDGAMLGALSSALEMHGDSVFISLWQSIPLSPKFVCENCE
jgi:hypothetical protein